MLTENCQILTKASTLNLKLKTYQKSATYSHIHNSFLDEVIQWSWFALVVIFKEMQAEVNSILNTKMNQIS